MGGFTPILSTLGRAVSLANTVNSAVNIGKQWSGADAGDEKKAMAQAEASLKAQQKLEMAQAQQDAERQRTQIKLDAAEAERVRQDALRRAVAKRKAEFGAAGIDSGDGSAEAVLLGLANDSDKDEAARASIDALKLAAIDDSLAQRRARNLLELTDLKSKNALRDLSRFG
jgi:hypothetical protein